MTDETGAARVRELEGQLLYETHQLQQRLAEVERERDAIQRLYDAGVAAWNPVYKIVCDERDALQRENATLQKQLEVANSWKYIQDLKRENQELKRACSEAPNANTLLIPEAQRFWEAMLHMPEVAQGHAKIFLNHLERLERELATLRDTLRDGCGVSTHELELGRQVDALQRENAEYKARLSNSQDELYKAMEKVRAQERELAAVRAFVEYVSIMSVADRNGEVSGELYQLRNQAKQALARSTQDIIGLGLEVQAVIRRRDELGRENVQLREALEKIAKPALGGKQQQHIAQQALAGRSGEE